MFALTAGRASGGVSCDADGVFVGDVPLLRFAGANGARESWTVRPIFEVNAELAPVYRLPIDIGAKANALALIANALNRSDLTMAAIATVQMQFPGPPPLAKGAEAPEVLLRRAAELHRSGLFKAEPHWDARHPRTGIPPNPGWFAPVPMSSEAPSFVPVVMPDEPWKRPDLVGGGGGGGGGIPRQGGSQPELPFPGGSPKLPSPAGSPPKLPSATPKLPAPDEAQPTLPFPGGLPPKLAPYVPGGKTYGVLQTPNLTAELQSGYEGPAKSMPPESDGFDGVTLSHVEGHAAALMRRYGIMEGTLFINNPEICKSCARLLPTMLPPGATLKVVLSGNVVIQFTGINP